MENKERSRTPSKEHIQLVVDQTGCSRRMARDTLMKTNDVVEAIMDIKELKDLPRKLNPVFHEICDEIDNNVEFKIEQYGDGPKLNLKFSDLISGIEINGINYKRF